VAAVCWSVSWRYRAVPPNPGRTRLSQCTPPAEGRTTAKPLKTKTRVLSIQLQSCKQLHRSCRADRALRVARRWPFVQLSRRPIRSRPARPGSASGWGAELFLGGAGVELARPKQAVRQRVQSRITHRWPTIAGAERAAPQHRRGQFLRDHENSTSLTASIFLL
jgi:hypothetical protein